MKTMKWLGILGAVVLVGLLIGAVAIPVLAQAGVPWGGWWHRGGGMVGGYYGGQGSVYGPGMMGGWRGMRGGYAAPNAPQASGGAFGYGGCGGPGMMGGYYGGYAAPNVEPITFEEAEEIAGQFAQSFGPGMEVAEVMQFEYNFYAEIVEEDTGIGAQEILIDPYTGAVQPEFGPNMMWNTRYGHMGRGGMMGGWFGQPSGEMSVTPEQARQAAQAYLDQAQSGLTVGDEVEPFYGYYTLHTLKDGEIEGMLSVNGYTGQVWYHSWHGAFVTMSEHHE